MVLWRDRTLAADLRDERVPERDKLWYLLVSLVIQSLVGRASILASFRSMPQLAGTLLILLISVGGTVIVFRVNQRGDNRRFLERYVCLTFPVGLKMYALWFVLAVGVYLLIGPHASAAGAGTFVAPILWSGIYSVLLVWFFARMRSCMAIAASGSHELPPA